MKPEWKLSILKHKIIVKYLLYVYCIICFIFLAFSVAQTYFLNWSSFLECTTKRQHVDVSACKYAQIPTNTFWSKNCLLNKRLWTPVLFAVDQALQKSLDWYYRSHLHCIIFKRDWKYQTQMHGCRKLI